MPAKTKLNDYYTGVGRRKSAVAQVRIKTGSKGFTVNNIEKPIPRDLERLLTLVDQEGKLDISVVARGGGIISQVTATCLGVARALVKLNEELRSTLRKGGYLTVDARVKERKKPGLKRARKAPQWAKR
jgi:small subunit ribosomal protein S9